MTLTKAIGVRAPSDLGGGDRIARKKLQNARRRQLFIRTQIAVKTKTFSILTSNETVIIPETQRNSGLLEPPRELMKIAFQNWTDREITAFD